MYIYILFSIIILLPLLASYKNKSKALQVSFVLLFFPLAFQYEVCHDWAVNVQRWIMANVSNSYGDLQIRDSEPLYLMLLHLFKPVGFFGFLIFSAAIQLWVFYKLIKRYVDPEYYWVSLFILLVYGFNFALYYINSNRQTYSMLLTVFAVWMLFEYRSKLYRNAYLKRLLFVFILVSAHSIHTAAYAAIGLIVIYFFVVRNKHLNIKWLLIICNVLFISRFFVDMSQYQQVLQTFWVDNGSAEDFSNYFNDLEEYGKGRIFSLWQQIPYFIAMNLMLIGYNKVNMQGHFFILCSVFSIVLNGFLVATLQRSMQYYSVFIWIALPMVLPHINKRCKQYRLQSGRNVMFAYLIAYALFQFQQNVNPEAQYYDGWYNYTSIFEATEWM